jgi:hypothetical protein
MPRRTTGSVYRTANGWVIRWPEDGRRRHQAGSKTKTEARRWFTANVAPRLDRGAPSPEITFDAFCELFLARHGASVSERTTKRLKSGFNRRGRPSATGPSPNWRAPQTMLPAGEPG